MVTTHTIFPTNFPPRFTNEVALEKRDEIECLVVGGTISTSAATRSKNVSFCESSEETEEREVDEEAAEDEEDA